jgi:hypothetical protein
MAASSALSSEALIACGSLEGGSSGTMATSAFLGSAASSFARTALREICSTLRGAGMRRPSWRSPSTWKASASAACSSAAA